MNKPVILVIDDEPQILKLLEIALESNGYKVILADCAKTGMALAASTQPDLILLDLNLPDKTGHETLLELRKWYSKAIIILSVLNSENDIVRALDNGATDYLTKPFRTAELMARIRAGIRKNTTNTEIYKYTFDDLEIDISAHTVKRNHILLKLTSTEFSLLALLVKNEGCVLTHQFLLKEIWGVGSQTETQYLRVFVGTLRKKIEENPNIPKHIITESGVGYRFQ